MSGGSFDYAGIITSIDELYEKLGQYEQIGEAFEADGFDDVAAEFAALVDLAKMYRRRIDARLNRLYDLAHAMEWQRSGDYGKYQVEKAVEQYRSAVEEHR